MGKPNPSTSLRRTALRRLPKLIRKAMADYAAFARQEAPADAKGFAVHQAACKSALAHLEAGAKLLAWAEDTSAAPQRDDDLVRMIEAAEEVIAAAGSDTGPEGV